MPKAPRSKSSTVQLDLFAQSQPIVALAVSPEPLLTPVTPPVPQALPSPPQIYSVSEISSKLREQLRAGFGEVLIQGEVADFKGVHRSGHLYFALKDEKAQIRAVMWKMSLQKVPFEIKAGLEVIVTGQLDYYGGSGSLQVVVTRMEPVGIGALQLKFEQLKEKLRKEGLFEAARKRVIPSLNWRIGLVTSKTGAALQDMLRIFKQRFPLAEIFLFHAAVQGEKASAELVAAIQLANRYSAQQARKLDVLVIGRGGGSYEDLFCFNDESVARAIVASKIPTVSAVGHEIDVTIADMVADKRSATPSHAAQEIVPEGLLWIERLSEIENRLLQMTTDTVHDNRQVMDHLHNRLLAAAPQKKLAAQKDFLQDRRRQIESLWRSAIERRQFAIARAASMLDALSPLKVLVRGYALTVSPSGKILRSVKDTRSGEVLEIRLSDGSLSAKVL